MSVSYSCDGIVKEFTIPPDELGTKLTTVTITFLNGEKVTYNSNSFILMDTIEEINGCVRFKTAPEAGTIITINSDDAETSEQTISRIDETVSEVEEKVAEVKEVQQTILNVKELKPE